ncbi:unnamed protein product [Echinostoma caproni]|uniref:RNase III domain-containing protein n=1 Tax=Echinostoma caproni TaxID=27848 RepID=A0A3P8L9A7_9TREM|nr:unnamed protein product [Echinostoma caproni]
MAYMMVKLGLHQHVIHAHPLLNSVTMQIEQLHSINDRSIALLEVLPSDMANINSSKVLADIFEALIGAVFLDTAGDLMVTSRVIFRCLRDRIGAHHQILGSPLLPVNYLIPYSKL